MAQSPERKKQYAIEYLSRPETKAARSAYGAEWRKKNKSRRAEKEAYRRRHRRGSCLVATARTRAKNRSLDFDLDDYVAEIQQRIDSGVCEITGVPFCLDPGRRYNSPSIDRIDPAKGYTYDNIRVVLNLVNAAMGDWGEDVLRDVVSTWLGRPVRPDLGFDDLI